MQDKNNQQQLAYGGLLTLSIIVISFVLRAPITSLGPLAEIIHNDIGVSNGFVGFLSTLPLIAFAICSPFISKLSNRFGIFATMLGGLVLITAGGIFRSYAGTAGLVIGTAMLGMGIATGNVLIPSLVKLRFQNHIGLGTGIFVTSMGVFASLGAGISYPMAVSLKLGWKTALAIWSGVSFAALLIWLSQYGLNREAKSSDTRQKGSETKKGNIWRSPLAWYLTMYMGLQSFLFYSITAWLPSIVMGNGMSPESAGYMALGFQLIGIPASFFIPILTSRIKNQKTIVISTGILYFAGFLTFLMTGPLPLLLIWLISLSVGAAASFGWIMTMVGICSKDAGEAAKLSGMSQSIGYLLAAFGPTLCGVVYDMTDTWTPIIILIAVIAALMTTFGILLSKSK